jgi:hypothetical protein
VASGRVALTDAGRALTWQVVPLTTAAQLHEAWCAKLPAPQARILRVLVQHYPAALDREALASAAGQSPTSSGYANNLGALRSLGVLDYPSRGTVAATPLLFPDGIPNTLGVSAV